MDLDANLTKQSQQGQWTGSVLVRQQGRTLLDRGYGAANREDDRPNTPDTVFQIASISKQFTAAAILLLQEWGVLTVEDRIRLWVPDCPDTWEPITVHHLLTHTSGIAHWGDLPELSLFKTNTWENLRRIFQGHPLKFAAGEGWAYSSPAFVLLAHIVEQASDLPYGTFLHQRIFHPLGMASTGVGNHAPRPEQQAVGYTGKGPEPEPSFELDTVSMGAGDIWSTTHDMARWDSALAAPGLLSVESLHEMFAPHAAVPGTIDGIGNMSYGYGWFIAAMDGHRLRYHDGDNAGFSSVNIQLPDDDALIILLSNEEINPQEISLHLVSELLASSVSAPLRPI